MKKISTGIFLVLLTGFLFSAEADQTALLKAKLNEFKKLLQELSVLAVRREQNSVTDAVEKGEKLVALVAPYRLKAVEFIEFDLYARQVIAGIYLHRLGMALKAISHYSFIIKDEYFKKNAPPFIKWVVYEGLGLAYYVQDKNENALSAFLDAYKYAQEIIKKEPSKGKSCLVSTSYNIACVYARLNSPANAVKHLQIALENSLSDAAKTSLKKMIKEDRVFSGFYNIAEFRALLR